MLEALIVVVLLAGGLALWWLLRGARALRQPIATPRQAGDPPRTAQARAAAASAPAPLQADIAPNARLPDDLPLVRHELLAAPKRQALLKRLQLIPRPPRALQQLVSPEFLARASSSELAELVMTEPMVAARVMAAVNAPLYGLRKPVTSVGQAITFLGLNTVRSLALQHLLRDTMPTQDRQLRQEFDVLWSTSATASELCLLVAKRLHLPDAAGMSTQLVLHFLGRFAAAALQPRSTDPAAQASTLRERALAEERSLGLSAGEIGTMLMHEWRLPDIMMVRTRDIARIVFVDAPAPDTRYAARLALCALCAALAERIARGELRELQTYDAAHDTHEDARRLAAHLEAPTLAALTGALREHEQMRLQS